MKQHTIAKVKAVNNAHAHAMKLYPALVEVFAPLVGQQVEKQDGTLLAKIAKRMPDMPNGNRLSVYKYNSRYSLVYMVKACENIEGGHGCTYYEIGVYIGEMQGGVLTKICNPPELRADYTVEELEAKRAAYEAAAKVASDLKSDLHPFGEYDR